MRRMHERFKSDEALEIILSHRAKPWFPRVAVYFVDFLPEHLELRTLQGLVTIPRSFVAEHVRSGILAPNPYWMYADTLLREEVLMWLSLRLKREEVPMWLVRKIAWQTIFHAENMRSRYLGGNCDDLFKLFETNVRNLRAFLERLGLRPVCVRVL